MEKTQDVLVEHQHKPLPSRIHYAIETCECGWWRWEPALVVAAQRDKGRKVTPSWQPPSQAPAPSL